MNNSGSLPGGQRGTTKRKAPSSEARQQLARSSRQGVHTYGPPKPGSGRFCAFFCSIRGLRRGGFLPISPVFAGGFYVHGPFRPKCFATTTMFPTCTRPLPSPMGPVRWPATSTTRRSDLHQRHMPMQPQRSLPTCCPTDRPSMEPDLRAGWRLVDA